VTCGPDLLTAFFYRMETVEHPRKIPLWPVEKKEKKNKKKA